MNDQATIKKLWNQYKEQSIATEKARKQKPIDSIALKLDAAISRTLCLKIAILETEQYRGPDLPFQTQVEEVLTYLRESSHNSKILPPTFEDAVSTILYDRIVAQNELNKAKCNLENYELDMHKPMNERVFVNINRQVIRTENTHGQTTVCVGTDPIDDDELVMLYKQDIKAHETELGRLIREWDNLTAAAAVTPPFTP